MLQPIHGKNKRQKRRAAKAKRQEDERIRRQTARMRYSQDYGSPFIFMNPDGLQRVNEIVNHIYPPEPDKEHRQFIIDHLPSIARHYGCVKHDTKGIFQQIEENGNTDYKPVTAAELQARIDEEKAANAREI